MKELKITSIFASVILSCVLIGCDFSVDEDDENDNNNNNGGTDYEYDFQNQDLQGEIEGEVWVYRAGTAEISFFDNTKLSIDILMWNLREEMHASSEYLAWVPMWCYSACRMKSGCTN